VETLTIHPKGASPIRGCQERKPAKINRLTEIA
jgi:hypothetical protein